MDLTFVPEYLDNPVRSDTPAKEILGYGNASLDRGNPWFLAALVLGYISLASILVMVIAWMFLPGPTLGSIAPTLKAFRLAPLVSIGAGVIMFIIGCIREPHTWNRDRARAAMITLGASIVTILVFL